MSTEGTEGRIGWVTPAHARVVISLHVRRGAAFTAQQGPPDPNPNDVLSTWLELPLGDGDLINLFGPPERLRLLLRGGIEALDRLEGAREGADEEGGKQ